MRPFSGSRQEVNMSNTSIRDAIGNAVAYLKAHPDEARYTDSPATAILEDGLAVTVHGPQGLSIRTDMPKSIGGAEGSPSPGWLLRAAQASCLATLIAMRAAEQGQVPGRIEVVVDSESDDRGILGIDDSVPAGPLSSRARVRELLGQSDEQLLQRVADEAEGKREQRFAQLTVEQKAAVFLQAFDKHVPVLLEEIQKKATRPIPMHEPGRRDPFHGDHNDEERRDLRIGQHVLTVIACEGDIE